VFEPGWRWSNDVRPIAKTDSCQAPHFQYHVSGRLAIRMDDGTELIAETGDVCFGTLHTNGCVSTINRVIDAFPAYQQPQIRAQLSMVLEGVLSQSLVPKPSGGRAMVLEVMIPTPAIRNLIREDKIHQIYSQMQLGQSKHGMQTANQCLHSLVSKKQITMEQAIEYSSDPEELKNMIASGGPTMPHSDWAACPALVACARCLAGTMSPISASRAEELIAGGGQGDVPIDRP